MDKECVAVVSFHEPCPYVLGSKLPLVPYNRGWFKGGMTIPNIGSLDPSTCLAVDFFLSDSGIRQDPKDNACENQEALQQIQERGMEVFKQQAQGMDWISVPRFDHRLQWIKQISARIPYDSSLQVTMLDGFGLYCPLGIYWFVMTCVSLATLEVHLALIGIIREDSSKILVNNVWSLIDVWVILSKSGTRMDQDVC